MIDGKLDDAFYETFGLLRARVHERIEDWIRADVRLALGVIWRETRSVRLWDPIAPQVNR